MKSARPSESSGSHGPYQRKNSSSSATSSGVRCSGSRSVMGPTLALWTCSEWEWELPTTGPMNFHAYEW